MYLLLQNIQPTRVFHTKSKLKLQQFMHLLSRWGDTLKRLKKMALPSNTLWGWPTQDLKCFKCLLPKHDAWFQEHGSGIGDLLLDRNLNCVFCYFHLSHSCLSLHMPQPTHKKHKTLPQPKPTTTFQQSIIIPKRC